MLPLRSSALANPKPSTQIYLSSQYIFLIKKKFWNSKLNEKYVFVSYDLSLSLFVLRQFSSLARVRRFPISAMPPQRTILGRLFLQTPLFYRVLYVLLPSLNRSPYPPLPLYYQPPACRYHVPFVLSLQMPKPP